MGVGMLLHSRCSTDCCFEALRCSARTPAAARHKEASTCRKTCLELPLRISVAKFSASESIVLVVARLSLVSELQQELSAWSGVPTQRQRLLLDGVILNESQSLAQAGVKDESHVTLIVMPEQVVLRTREQGSENDVYYHGPVERETWTFPHGMIDGATVAYEFVQRDPLPPDVAWRHPCELQWLSGDILEQSFPVQRCQTHGTVLSADLDASVVIVRLDNRQEPESIDLQSCKFISGGPCSNMFKPRL